MTRHPDGLKSFPVKPIRVIVAALALLLAGCAAVGPRTIRHARFNYNEAVVRTFDEQLLLNLVRLRYRDTPYFLEVANISTQYEFRGTASAGAALGDGEGIVDTGVGVGFVERPTIVYAPLAGADFARRLLTPLSPESLFLLTGAGWRTDRVLRCGVVRINDVWNAPEASGPTPDRPPVFLEFRQVATLLSTLKKRREVEIVYRSEDEPPRLLLRFTGGPSEERARLERLLGLEGGSREVPVRLNSGDPAGAGLRVATRSLIGVMYYLSQAVETPERDRDAGRVTVTRHEDGTEFDWSEILDGLLSVRFSETRPDNAFVKIFYRDTWFYIDDSDLDSKSTFNLLGQLFNLQAGDVGGGGPILTLPLGG